MDDPDLYSLPGYRFSPTDDELIDDYLKLKITGKDNKNTWRIPEIDIYKYEPWDLPNFARIPTKDKVWYFITAQSLKHKNGNSMNRSTKKGYWKSTGTDRKIKSGGEVIAMKKSLGYHIGRSPNGERTEWKMYEYRTTQKEFDGKHPGQKALVLIRLFVDQEKNTKGGPAVSLDTTFCIEETKSKSSLAPVSPALEVQAETHQTSNQSCYVKISDDMLSDATAPVQCKTDNYNYHNAYVAEKQEAEMTSSEDGFYVDEMISDATEPVQFKNDNYNYQNAYVAEKQRAEMTSSEDDCNVEKYWNMLSAFDFNADEMMFDATAPVQFKNDDFNSEVDFNVEENLNKFCFTPPDDSQSSLPPITPDVSTFIGNKSSYEETLSEPTLAPASQALLEQAEKNPTNGRTRFYIVAPLACNNGYNAYTAENQVAEVKATEFELGMEEALKMFCPHPPEPLDRNFSPPSTLTSVTPAVSFPTTVKASPEEAQSMLVPASVSPELGSEVDNYPRCCPAENSDGITSSTIPPIEYNGYNTNVSKEEVAEITSDEVEAGLNTFPVTPQPLGCNVLSPLHSHMQADLGSSCISYPFTNDLISGHWGVHHQSGTNESAPNIAESWDLTPYNPDDFFCYKYSSQINLAFDDETQENMVSVKDNGSCRGSDAIAEFELEYQDLLLEEIINPKVSPGLLKSGSYLGSLGGSSDQIIGSD